MLSSYYQTYPSVSLRILSERNIFNGLHLFCTLTAIIVCNENRSWLVPFVYNSSEAYGLDQ